MAGRHIYNDRRENDIMKALIRNRGEIVRESDGIEGIDWNTGAPLTNSEWCGGPYKLVENYSSEIESEISGDPSYI